jgi:hypothetical protein
MASPKHPAPRPWPLVLAVLLASCSFSHSGSHSDRGGQDKGGGTDLNMTGRSTMTTVAADDGAVAFPSPSPELTPAVHVATTAPRVGAATTTKANNAVGSATSSSVAPAAVTVVGSVSDPAPPVGPPPTVVIDSGPAPVARHGAAGVASGEGSMWVRTGDYGANSPTFTSLVQIDPATGHRLAVTPLDINSYGGVMASNGWVWLDDYGKDQVVRVDSRSQSVIEKTPLSSPFFSPSCAGRFAPQPSLVAGAGSIWVQGGCGAVARIDQTTGKVTTVLDTRTDGRDNRFVKLGVFGNDGLWVSQGSTGVALLDPATNKVGPFTPLTGFNGTWVAQQIVNGVPGQLWVLANDGDGTTNGNHIAVFRIDEATRAVAPMRVVSRFDFGDLLAADGNVFWIRAAARLRSVDAATGKVIADLNDVPNCIPPVPIAAGAAWCGSIDSYVFRIATGDGATWKVRIG